MNSGAMQLGPRAFPHFSFPMVANISNSVKAAISGWSVLIYFFSVPISALISLLISFFLLWWRPFSISKLAIVLALTGHYGAFFMWLVRWLKVCWACLLECMKSMDAVAYTHRSLCFSSNKFMNSLAFMLASVPGVALVTLYAC